MTSIIFFTGGEDDIIKLKQVTIEDFQKAQEEHKKSFYASLPCAAPIDSNGYRYVEIIEIDEKNPNKVSVKYFNEKNKDIFFGVPYRLTKED
jgi:hypothetical protein